MASSRHYIENCPYCGHQFYVDEEPMGVPGGKDLEDIDCPYCLKTVSKKMTDGIFHTAKKEQDRVE